MALLITTWKWGNKYSLNDVRKLRAGIDRHLRTEHYFTVFSDSSRGLSTTEYRPIRNVDLLAVKGCFARLRLFDPEIQEELGICAGDRIVCIDLDVVITGSLDPLFHRPEPFMILQGANAANPCKYNGSIWMLRAGYRPDVWRDFSLSAAQRIPFHDFPDDQGWLHHKLPNENGWHVGSTSGIYAFQKTAWPKSDALPPDARMVVFPGWRDPSKFTHLPWIKKHWRQ